MTLEREVECYLDAAIGGADSFGVLIKGDLLVCNYCITGRVELPLEGTTKVLANYIAKEIVKRVQAADALIHTLPEPTEYTLAGGSPAPVGTEDELGQDVLRQTPREAV